MNLFCGLLLIWPGCLNVIRQYFEVKLTIGFVSEMTEVAYNVLLVVVIYRNY